MDRDLLQRIPNQPARVLILPTAAAHQGPGRAAANGIGYFRGLGATADALMVLDHTQADEAQYAARTTEADLVYLTGGDPRHLLDTLRASAVWGAMQDCYQHGGLIAGSSAGAMALVGWMRGGQGEWTPALGLAPNIAVLPHHEHAREETVRQSLALLDPLVTLLGIDTATAAVSAGGPSWQVAGVGRVSVYRRGQVTRYAAGEGFALP
jgi:cyanophycinase-like exopeptidase